MACPSLRRAGPVLSWMDTTLPSDQRAALRIEAITLERKVQQIANRPEVNDELQDE